MRVSFILAEPYGPNKKPKSTPCTLFVHVIESREHRFKIKSPFRVIPKEWNFDRQEPKYTCENAEIIMSYISRTKADIMKIITDNIGKPFDTIMSAVKLQNGVSSGPSVHRVFDEYLEAQAIIKSQKSVMKYKSIRPYLIHDSFEKYDLKFLDEFIKAMLDDNKLNSTINKKMEMMRSFFKWSEVRGYHKNAHIFSSEAHRFPRSDNNEVIALSEEECARIAAVELESTTDDYIRNLFLLSCHSGSRISDLRSVSASQIVDNAWVFEAWKTRKSKVQIKIPFIGWCAGAKEYLDKVLAHKIYVSEKHMNERIKYIAERAEINQMIRKTRMSGPNQIVFEEPKYNFISIHSGRKTFISVLLNIGMPISTVKKLSGISNLKTLMRYIDTQESDVARELSKNF